MPECFVTRSFLATFIAQHAHNALVVEAQLDQAKELLEIANYAGGGRRLTQLRAFLLVEAIITRPRTVLDPIASTTWKRSRFGLKHVLTLTQDARNEIIALDAEQVLGGTQRTHVTAALEQANREKKERLLELVEGCARFLSRTLRPNDLWQSMHNVGRLGLMAFSLYNTPIEAMNLAQELLEQTEESNRRAWEAQTLYEK